MPLGELRQAIIAVVVGNPHFIPEEQLLINHEAHEREGQQELSQWLRALRLDDAHRQYVARLRAIRATPKPIVLDEAAQDAELLRLLACPDLGQAQKAALATLFAYSSIQPSGRLRLLGNAYTWILGEAGHAEPYCGIEGLYEN
jgi:hypothetical protein